MTCSKRSDSGLERSLEVADEEDKKYIMHILGNFDEIFRIDTPYKLTIVHPEEFLRSNIYIEEKSHHDI